MLLYNSAICDLLRESIQIFTLCDYALTVCDGTSFIFLLRKTTPPKNKFPKRLYGGQPVFDVIWFFRILMKGETVYIYKSSTNLIVREMSKFPILQKLTHMMVLIMMINWLWGKWWWFWKWWLLPGICNGRWKFTFITEYPLGPLKPRKCSAILLVGYIFRYTTAMLKTQVTVVVQHCNSGIACYCYWYNTAVLVTQSQMELYSMMYQGLANLDVKPIWSRNVMIWYSDGTTKK